MAFLPFLLPHGSQETVSHICHKPRLLYFLPLFAAWHSPSHGIIRSALDDLLRSRAIIGDFAGSVWTLFYVAQLRRSLVAPRIVLQMPCVQLDKLDE